MLSQPLEEASVAPADLEQRLILIVDDDESLAEVLSIRLSNQGFQTAVAHTGRAALSLAQAEQPDLILLDLHLPDIDGFELCQQLVDDEATSEIPIIIVSGLQQSDILRRSRAAGCHYFVHKPYDPNVLLTLIEQTLEEAQSE